jgi:class 3 adenylate cyclase/tetratricopeptide (TPR) repeat protein
VVSCPSCGEQNVDRARFCLNCGSSLIPEPAAAQERKLVSILFVDLVGFTARSDQADPEDVRETLQAYHARAKEQVQQFGGTIEKYIGDAVMAVFGAPVSRGDDAERAVRSGLAVLASIEDLNRERPGLDLAARAAVNTGEAVVALRSRAESGEALALGDVVNTAARLQTSAPPGGLIVGEETYRATRRAFRYEQLVSIEAKGKRDPVPAWLVLEPATAGMQRPSIAPTLIGREREMDLLRSIWERAVMERHPHLVTILGPPGIGKTRLTREISSLVQDRGHRVLHGRCLPYENTDVYGAFAHQVKQLAGIFEQDAPDTMREKIATQVDRLVPTEESPEVTRSLSLLLGLGLDEPVDERTLMFFSARRFLEQLTAEQPTVLVFEDVHWASAGELDLIEYLAGRARDSALVVLALARPELLDERPGWGGGPIASSTIILEPLPASAASRIAARWVGDDVAPEDLEKLVEVAEGNPLFVEELAASLAGGMRPGSELPTTVRVAIAARIDALPPAERAALLDASVVGKVFWRGSLAAMEHEGIDAILDTLEARDLIRREPVTQMHGDSEFSFKHVLIRDVAYGTLPRQDRRSRHGTVARYVEDMAGEQVRDMAWLLAYHWREAGEPASAIEYLLIAAERARDAWATEEAIRLFDSALDLATDDAGRRRIQLARGQAMVRLDEYETAVGELGELLPELDGFDELEALLGRGRAAQWTEETDLALEMAERAVAAAERLGSTEYVAPALGRLSQAYAMRGAEGDLDRATEVGDRALGIWIPNTKLDELAEHNVMHAHTYYWTGRYAEGVELARAGRALAVDSGSREALLRGGTLEGASLAAMGRYEEALAVFEERIALGRLMGRPVRVILNYSTVALRDIYDLDEARRRNEEALEQQGWSSFNMPWQNAEVDLVLADLLAGDLGSAELRWAKAWDDVTRGAAWQRWYLVGKMAAARAELSERIGRHDEAADWALKAIEMAIPVHRRKYEVASRITLGRAFLSMGRVSDALNELRAASDGADALGSPPGRWQARAVLARALVAAGRDAEGEVAISEAKGVIDDMAAGLAPERAKVFLSAGPVREVLDSAL